MSNFMFKDNKSKVEGFEDENFRRLNFQSNVVGQNLIKGITTFNSVFKNNSEMAILINKFVTKYSYDFISSFENCDTIKVLQFFDTSNAVYFQKMFKGCTSLVEIPLIDVSFIKSDIYKFIKEIVGEEIIKTFYANYSEMFMNCSSLQFLPNLKFYSGNFDNIFHGCIKLKKVPDSLSNIKIINGISMFDGCISLEKLPDLDVSEMKNFTRFFTGCAKLTSIPDLDVSKGTNFANMFDSVNEVVAFTDNPLCTVKPWQFGEDIDFGSCKRLNHASLMKIINGLKQVDVQKNITLSRASNSLLSDEERQIITNKNWNLVLVD